VLQAIAGHDPQDPASIDRPVPDYCAEIEVGVRGLRIGVERDYYLYEGVTDDVRAAVEDVIADYEQQGATVVEVSIPELAFTVETLLTIMLSEASTYHRQFLRRRGADYDPATRAMLELGELVPATHYLTAQRARSLFRNAIRRLFQEYHLDAMLGPTIPLPTAPLEALFTMRQDGIGETPMGSYIHHTFSANLTGQPAISVPCGLSRAGLPIGFQLMGRPFAEATLLRLARAYERNHTWHALYPTVVS
jgi:aspartyl-tRNA(Asn)/glutamyl-tRNA(Gln) amidotransferase subunit A